MKKHSIHLATLLGLLSAVLLSGCNKRIEPNTLFSDVGSYTSPDGKTVVTIEKNELKCITFSIVHETASYSASLKPQYQPIMCWSEDSTLWVNLEGYVHRFHDHLDEGYYTAYKTNTFTLHGGKDDFLENKEFEEAIPEAFKEVLLASLNDEAQPNQITSNQSGDDNSE